MTKLFTPLTRSFAIASLTGAALLTGSLGPVAAQTPDSKTPLPVLPRDSVNSELAVATQKVEQLEKQAKELITQLKTALKITPDQDAKWTAVAQSMRDNASAMEKLVATKRAIPPEKTTAVDDLKTYQEFTEVRLDGLKHLNSAFKSLYDSMPAEQKKNADMVFEKYGPSKPATQG